MHNRQRTGRANRRFLCNIRTRHTATYPEGANLVVSAKENSKPTLPVITASVVKTRRDSTANHAYNGRGIKRSENTSAVPQKYSNKASNKQKCYRKNENIKPECIGKWSTLILHSISSFDVVPQHDD